jgi:hypothetical protein
VALHGRVRSIVQPRLADLAVPVIRFCRGVCDGHGERALRDAGGPTTLDAPRARVRVSVCGSRDSYAIQLLAVAPSIQDGDTDGLGFFAFANPHGFFAALEALGYGFMILALLLTAPAFRGRALERRIRIAFVGAFALPVLPTASFERSDVLEAAHTMRMMNEGASSADWARLEMSRSRRGGAGEFLSPAVQLADWRQ